MRWEENEMKNLKRAICYGMSKKMIVLSLILFLGLMSFMEVKVYATETVTVDGLIGTVDEDEGIFTAISCESTGDVVIPARVIINEKTYVVHIDSALSDLDKGISDAIGFFSNAGEIQSITFEEGVIVDDCEGLFFKCSNINSLNLSNINTSNVTNMSYMFYYCRSLASLDLNGLDTSNVTDMSYMFDSCIALTNLDLSKFNTGNVTDMSYMFYFCRLLTSLSLNGFETNDVTNMNYMFYRCSALTSLDLSGLDTSNVTYMSGMFNSCSALTSLDLSGLDTSNVTNMDQMFAGCSALTSLDLSGFDTSNVNSMESMFGCSALTSLDLSGFNTDNVTNMRNMFSGCSSLTSLDLSSFDTKNVTKMNYMFYRCSALTSLDLSGLDTSNVTYMSGMFSGCSSLTSLDLSSFDTKNVTNMNYMFYRCSALTSLDLSGFDTSNVTSMEGMFKECIALTNLDLSGFDTSNVTNMGELFRGCSALISLNVSSFDTTNVRYMEYMFSNCSSLESLDLSSFDIYRHPYYMFVFGGECNIRFIKTPRSINTGYPIQLPCEFVDESGWTISYIDCYRPSYTIRRKYSVTFNTNGGSISEDNTSYYVYGLNTNLPTEVIKNGYSFEGWYENEGCTGLPVTVISDTSTGDKVYYAKWKQITDVNEKTNVDETNTENDNSDKSNTNTDNNGTKETDSDDTTPEIKPKKSDDIITEVTSEEFDDTTPEKSPEKPDDTTPEVTSDEPYDITPNEAYPSAQAVEPIGIEFSSYQGVDFYKDDSGDVRCYTNGVPVINDFKCDGEFTYFFQADGTAMKDRLTYHPDGEHVIYFDSEGHEVFSDFANVKKTIAGDEVDDYCFFDVFGYMYVDVVTYDKTGTVLYYANAYGVMEMGKWFQFSDKVMWADGREGDEFKNQYGCANADGTLITNTQTIDWEGRSCYLQGNGVAIY